MKLLVLDGNSIVNRAFYGIKLLTTKSGEYTNAIYGFLNILLKLEDICTPDAVAVRLMCMHLLSGINCMMNIKPAERVCLMNFALKCRC